MNEVNITDIKIGSKYVLEMNGLRAIVQVDDNRQLSGNDFLLMLNVVRPIPDEYGVINHVADKYNLGYKPNQFVLREWKLYEIEDRTVKDDD